MIEERFGSLEEALKTNTKIEKALGRGICAFRWQSVPGSTDVVAEFWIPPPRHG
jgi:hypothetical protein